MDNNIGRFISIEPVVLALHDNDRLKALTGNELQGFLQDPQKLQYYSYSRNNPIILVDLDGNWWKELITGKQSFSDFKVELGQAANQLYNDSGAWKAAMDHPVATGVAVGLAGGAAAAGATVALGGSIACGIFCGSAAATVGATSGTLAATQANKIADGLKLGQSFGRLGTVIQNAPGKINGFVSQFTKNPTHGLDQAITRGVSPQTLLDTVKNPLVSLQQSSGNIFYLTNRAVVVLDKAGKLVTTYGSQQFQSHVTNILNKIK